MDYKELANATPKSLVAQAAELRGELYSLSLKRTVSTLKNHRIRRATRRNLARVLTKLTQLEG